MALNIRLWGVFTRHPQRAKKRGRGAGGGNVNTYPERLEQRSDYADEQKRFVWLQIHTRCNRSRIDPRPNIRNDTIGRINASFTLLFSGFTTSRNHARRSLTIQRLRGWKTLQQRNFTFCNRDIFPTCFQPKSLRRA